MDANTLQDALVSIREFYRELRMAGATHTEATLVCFADSLTAIELAAMVSEPDSKFDSLRRKADRIKKTLLQFPVVSMSDEQRFMVKFPRTKSPYNKNNNINNSKNYLESKLKNPPTTTEEEEIFLNAFDKQKTNDSSNFIADKIDTVNNVHTETAALSINETLPDNLVQEISHQSHNGPVLVTEQMKTDALFMIKVLSEQYPYVTFEYALSTIIGTCKSRSSYNSKQIRSVIYSARNTTIRKTVSDYIVGTVNRMREQQHIIRQITQNNTSQLIEDDLSPKVGTIQPNVEEQNSTNRDDTTIPDQKQPLIANTIYGQKISKQFHEYFIQAMTDLTKPKDGKKAGTEIRNSLIVKTKEEVIIRSYLSPNPIYHDYFWNNEWVQKAIIITLEKMHIHRVPYRIVNSALELQQRKEKYSG